MTATTLSAGIPERKKDHADGSIGSLLKFYKAEKRIFGRCPHCQEPLRLSEVKLTYGKEPPNDLLTRMKSERERLEELESNIETSKRTMKVNWRT